MLTAKYGLKLCKFKTALIFVTRISVLVPLKIPDHIFV